MSLCGEEAARWGKPSRKLISGLPSKMAVGYSVRLLSREAILSASSSTSGEIGYEGAAFGSSGLGGAMPATAASSTSTRLGTFSGGSISSVASRSIRSVIRNFGSSSVSATMTSACKQTRLRRPEALLAGAVWLSLAAPSVAVANPLPVSDFGQLALRCGPSVAPSTLASIARTESGFQVLTINDNTTGISGVPATHEIAVQLAASLLEAGHSVDLGIMQINSGNFAKLGLTAESAFDPCKSIAAAASVLAGSFAGGETHEGQQTALRVALSKYNTGDAKRGFENGYVHKVELSARRVVPALDVGGPTASIDSAPLPAAAPIAPVDPNAPPAWDVWASYDYAAAHHGDDQALARPPSGAGLVELSDAGHGPSAPATILGPNLEK